MSVVARALVLMIFALAAVGSTVYGIASHRVSRTYATPAPPIARAVAPEEVARGERLFRHLCIGCHAPEGAARAIGGRVAGAPPFLGDIWAPNLTQDRTAGIGAASDGDLARLLRNGIRRDGRYAAGMPRFARLGDRDVAALIGFLRSPDPLFAAASESQPQTRLGVIGTLILGFGGGISTDSAAHVATPTPGPTAAYGEYLASAIYGCVDCHTEGMGQTEEKLRSIGLLAGGYGRRDTKGEPIFAANLTPDPESGLGRWSRDELARTVRAGVGRDGRRVRSPMPKFPHLDDTEVDAIFAYLRSRPPIARRVPPRPAGETSGTPPGHSDSR